MLSQTTTPKSAPTDVSTTRHASRYLIIGVIVTLFNFGVYTLIAQLIIRNNDFLWLSNLIATFITVFVAFALHSKITWKERYPGKTGIIKFFIWNALLTFAISPGLTWFFTLPTPLYELAFNISEAIHLPFSYDLIQSTGVFVLTNIVIMILNFIFYDKFVFSDTPSQTSCND